MRPSIGGLPVYYYFISNFATFPQTDTPVLTDYRVSHPQMTILQIRMISRIGWTILTLFALPYSMISYCLLLSCHALHIWGVVSLVYCPPSPWHWVAFSFYPSLRRSSCIHILLSFIHSLPSLLLSQTILLYLGLPKLSLEKPGFA